jgi:hypothetical protein
MRGINPCTNCRLDSLSCVLANSSRGRRVTNTDSDGNVDVFQMEVVSAVGNENEREHSNGFLDRNTSGVRDGSLGDNPHGDLDGSVNANPHGIPGGLPAVHERPRTDNLPVSLTFEGERPSLIAATQAGLFVEGIVMCLADFAKSCEQLRIQPPTPATPLNSLKTRRGRPRTLIPAS